jgi:hypothetical protein
MKIPDNFQHATRLPRKPESWLCVLVVYAICHIFRSNYYTLPATFESSLELELSRPRQYIHDLSTNNTTTLNAPSLIISEISQSNPLSLIPGPVFFNIFVSANLSNVRRILKEQFIQRNLTSPNATIEYTLIGDDFLDEEIQQVCQPNCQQRKHIKSGDEVETLQALWEYCRQLRGPQQEDVLVTYLHNKGSFHPTASNEKSRRMGTKAALDCRLLMAASPRQCTICTSAFHVFPQYLGSSK